VKILKLPKDKLDLFASVVQQFGEIHAPVEQDGKYAFNGSRTGRMRGSITTAPSCPRRSIFFRRARPCSATARGGLRPRHRGSGQAHRAVRRARLRYLRLEHPGPRLRRQVEHHRPRLHRQVPTIPTTRRGRKHIAIIVSIASPTSQCFCRSMRADFVDHGFDLFFYEPATTTRCWSARPSATTWCSPPAASSNPSRQDDITEYKSRSLDSARPSSSK